MLAPSPRRGHSPEPFFRRLDRAAAALNPFLTIIVIGFIIINVIVVFSLVVPLGPTYSNPSTCSSPLPQTTGAEDGATANEGADGKY